MNIIIWQAIKNLGAGTSSFSSDLEMRKYIESWIYEEKPKKAC